MAKAKATCNGTNRAGQPCGAVPILAPDSDGKRWCTSHHPELPESMPRFGKDPELRAIAAKRAGETMRHPRAVDLLRKKLEEDLEAEVLGVFKDAIVAQRAIVVRDSEGNEHVEFVTDHGTRIRAAEVMYDRAYGKPKQITELSGPDGAPVEIQAPADAMNRSQRAAMLLANAGALDPAVAKAAAGTNGNGNGHRE